MALSERDLVDEALIGRVASGDKQALEALYDRYERLVFSFAHRVLRDPHLAEEVMQDVFLRIWQRAARFEGGRGRFSSWLLNITHNLAVDRVRQARARGVVLPDPQGAPAQGAPAADIAEHALLAYQVQEALAGLTPDQREAMELAYFQGFTHTEIARRTRSPVGTVKSRLYHGLLKLRTILTEGKEAETRRGKH